MPSSLCNYHGNGNTALISSLQANPNDDQEYETTMGTVSISSSWSNNTATAQPAVSGIFFPSSSLLAVLFLGLLGCIPSSHGFSTPHAGASKGAFGLSTIHDNGNTKRIPMPAAIGRQDRSRNILFAAKSTEEDTSLLEEIRSMRVKEIKEELTALKVNTQDAFEKEELVQRLFKARQNPSPKQQQQATAGSSTQSSQSNTNGVLQAPLYFTSLDAGTRLAAVNGESIDIDAKDHPYPSIKISASNAGGKEFELHLLLDTACSGFVLRPSVVQKHNLPSLSTPVTMTGAGGTASNTGLTQLERFYLPSSNDDPSTSPKMFGPLPAAVQDIGALPSSLDGIIGLSFLNQFEGAELDFQNGLLSLYPKGQALPPISSDLKVVAEGAMSLIPSLSIYLVDVMLGNRGPVKMLVDTGASDSFLNWKGVSDLGLDPQSKFLQRLPTRTGAMGSDNIAMELTHRINISSSLNLGSSKTSADHGGLTLQGPRRLGIDIGNIAILESLKNDGVGGIMGIDVFCRCDAVRMTFQGTNRSVQLMLNKVEVEAS